jgi:hypothetical protein
MAIPATQRNSVEATLLTNFAHTAFCRRLRACESVHNIRGYVIPTVIKSQNSSYHNDAAILFH